MNTIGLIPFSNFLFFKMTLLYVAVSTQKGIIGSKSKSKQIKDVVTQVIQKMETIMTDNTRRVFKLDK